MGQKYQQLQIKSVDVTGEGKRNRKTNTAFEEKACRSIKKL